MFFDKKCELQKHGLLHQSDIIARNTLKIIGNELKIKETQKQKREIVKESNNYVSNRVKKLAFNCFLKIRRIADGGDRG